jgi:ABC-type antimicrobial peptide transport system permease subunit
MRTPAAGIAVGLVASVAAMRFLTHLLFEITPTDPATFAVVGALLAAIAAAACYMAARRTLRLNPLAALRES